MVRHRRPRFLQTSLALAAGLLVGCGGLPQGAQPPAEIPRVGVLSNTPREPEAGADRVLRALSRLGYAEGQTVAVEWRFAETSEQLPAGPERPFSAAC